jgi:hypothetical protein
VRERERETIKNFLWVFDDGKSSSFVRTTNKILYFLMKFPISKLIKLIVFKISKSINSFFPS